ncbi:MAG: gliding motility-associated ABC transporter substrate-binding protein GldG [Bacteroidales bacterium]|nr:gliding motility-associated ABC transporter substrate-binding protein GldG [Bacteroidales bacterium]
MLTLLLKEIQSFLNSLIGYIVIAVFLLINGLFLWVFPMDFNILNFGYATLDSLFILSPFVFLFLIPALTMRAFSEEKRIGSNEILFTKPLTDTQIVLAKYLSGFSLVIFSLLPTLVYFFSVYYLGYPKGNIDVGGTVGSYIGLMLLGASFAAIGVFCSSLTDNQIVSFIVALFLCLFLYMGFEFVSGLALFGKVDLFFQSLGMYAHYKSLSRGVIDTRDLIYFLSLIALFLLLTKFNITSRKRRPLTQLIVAVVIVICTNVIGHYFFTRIDLTAEKRYTLSTASKKVLKKMDDIIYVEVYLEGDFPSNYKRLRNATREMLDELRAYYPDIEYEFINPSDSPIEEERINEYRRLYDDGRGLQPATITQHGKDGVSQQLIFPGAFVSYKGRKTPVQLLQEQIDFGISEEEYINNSIQNIEYTFVNAFNKLSRMQKPSVALIKGQGVLNDRFLVDIFYTLLQDYSVEQVELNGNINALTERTPKDSLGHYRITNKFNTIILAQPTHTFEEKDKFIIDQFIMHGGRVLWLVDPVGISMDSLQSQSVALATPFNLNLEDQLFGYGVRLNYDLIADLNCLPIMMITGYSGNTPQFNLVPWYFFPLITPSTNHVIVRNLNALKTQFVSSLDTVEAPGIKKTILLTSSAYSRSMRTPVVVDLNMARQKQDERLYNKKFLPVAVLLEGSFKSLYANRMAPELTENPIIGFKEESKPTAMIVVSDGDIIRNQLDRTDGAPKPLGYDQDTRQMFGNKDFIVNAVSYLSDDDGLISIRSREIKIRLLDKTRINASELFWQILNVVAPIVLIVLFGIAWSVVRRRRYGL